MVIAAGIESNLITRIENARRGLLDLSARNRLISTPRKSSQGRKVEIADERSEEVFRLLVRERKAMSLPGGHRAARGRHGRRWKLTAPRPARGDDG